MSLSSQNLDAFYACALTGNFTRAAEKLHISQSALSQRVLNLEQEIETTLFIRDRKGVMLTPAGQELLRYCQAKEALEEESLSFIKNQASDQLSGYLRIGGFSSVMRSVVLPVLSPLLRENPQVKLLMMSREMDELPDLLRRGEIDFMIMDREWSHEGVESHLLGCERNALVEKKGYQGGDIYLDHDENDQTTSRYLKARGMKQTFERRFLDDVYGLIEGVKLGLGRAVLPLHLVKLEKSLKVLAPKTVLEIPVYLYYHSQPYYTQLYRKVVERLENGCRDFLGQDK